MLIIRWKESLNVSTGTRDNIMVAGLKYINKYSPVLHRTVGHRLRCRNGKIFCWQTGAGGQPGQVVCLFLGAASRTGRVGLCLTIPLIRAYLIFEVPCLPQPDSVLRSRRVFLLIIWSACGRWVTAFSSVPSRQSQSHLTIDKVGGNI